ncbi:MAG: hypothetical protein P8Z68_05275 [Kineosporiaceae bacterium]
MAVNEEVSNPILRERTGLQVDRAARERLVAAGLLVGERRGRAIWYELTDAGWAWCGRELSGPFPPGSDTGTRGLYAVLAGLRVHLTRADLRLSEVFGRETEIGAAAGPAATGKPTGDGAAGPGDAPGAAPGAAPERTSGTAPETGPGERIRAAYRELAGRPGDWVSLSPVRDRLADVPKADVDEALRQLEREPDVHLAPETAQFDLTAADRAAAVRIGGKDNHLIKVDRS